MSGSDRAARWKLVLERIDLLSSPRTDVAQADREIEALVGDSWLGRRIGAIGSVLRAAWQNSLCRRLLGRPADFTP
jgi:hypothetical protein